MRRWAVTVTIVALLGSALFFDRAAANSPPEGYCEDGKPVITYMPPDGDRYSFRCFNGVLTIYDNSPDNAVEVPIEQLAWPQPADLAQWAFIHLNGKRMVNPYADAQPYLAKSSRVLIPIRFVSEGIGAQVDWDEETQKVIIRWKDRTVELTINKPTAYVNGRAVALDQPPILFMNRTMVPVRVVAEGLGAKVDWVAQGSIVDITLPGAECAPRYCPFGR